MTVEISVYSAGLRRHHSINSSPVRLGKETRDPFGLQVEVRTEPFQLLLARRAERRAVLVGNQIVDRQVIPAGFEPAKNSADVVLAPRRVNRAKERVLENPTKRPGASRPENRPG